MLEDSYVGENTTVIDVKIVIDENGKLCSMQQLDTLEGKSESLHLSPGGVGAVTTAVLANIWYRRLSESKIIYRVA